MGARPARPRSGQFGLWHWFISWFTIWSCIPQQFYVEDAGIRFSYAKHLVEGEGLVYPGASV